MLSFAQRVRCSCGCRFWRKSSPPYSDVRIVLSTSWVRELGFAKAKGSLSPGLQSRVIGETWHSKMARYKEGSHRVPDLWSELMPYQQIANYIQTKKPTDPWIAIDDNFTGWDPSVAHRLVPTDGATGLSNLAAQQLLRELLDSADRDETGLGRDC